MPGIPLLGHDEGHLAAGHHADAHLESRTGLFTSPYITDFRERFQINGEEIPEETLARILGRLMPMVEEMAERGEVITEFELAIFFSG